MNRKNVDVVLVRMDKLGDLVVSLPVDTHPVLRGLRTHWFVSRGTGFIPRQAEPRRLYSEFTRGFSPFEFARAWRWFRRERPRTVVFLHNPWWVSLAAWLARVPERIGRRSQWHSLLFFNVGIRQKRSLAERHESDYNFDLVEAGFNRLGARVTSALDRIKAGRLELTAPDADGAVARLGLVPRGYRVVHPGMAGSALNWPQARYRELILRLAAETPVLITGTKMDREYLVELEDLKSHANVRWLVGELDVMALLGVLRGARGVVAPSTGIVHLAAALGTPTVGLYSPRRVEHPRRWGPKGRFAEYLVPPVNEAEDFPPEVMELITVEDIVQTLGRLESDRVRAAL